MAAKEVNYSEAMVGFLEGTDKTDDENTGKQINTLIEPCRRRRTKTVQELGRFDGEGAIGKSEDERDPDFNSLATKRGPEKRRGRPPKNLGTSSGRGRGRKGSKRGRKRRGDGVLPGGPGRPKGKRSLARRKEEEAKKERMKIEEEVYERCVC